MTSPITRPKPGSQGFTLVEMLLVVVIIGVVASIAVPRFSNSFDSVKARSGAYDVAATIDYARATSILEERTLRFSVSDDGRSCRVSEEREPAGRKPMRSLHHDLPEGVEIEDVDYTDPLSGDRPYIDFRPDGDCEPCVVTVLSRSGRRYHVSVTRGIGRARVVPATERYGG